MMPFDDGIFNGADLLFWMLAVYVGYMLITEYCNYKKAGGIQ
jgi:hypothetical protein